MRIAHHCFACGTDLTPISARIDDRLGLALVTCPTCRRTHVRRPLVARRRWRRIRRGALACLVLVLQVGLLAGATALVFFGAGLLDDTSRHLLAGREPEISAILRSLDLDLPPVAALALPLCMFAVAGLWHGMSLGHLGAWRSVVGFLLWVVVVVLGMATVEMFLWDGEHRDTMMSSLASFAVGLTEGGLVFVVASLLGRRAAKSRRDWRRRRYRQALANRRLRNFASSQP